MYCIKSTAPALDEVIKAYFRFFLLQMSKYCDLKVSVTCKSIRKRVRPKIILDCKTYSSKIKTVPP